MGLHAYGISRNMGGWRNWSQNLLNGPPLPAPPSFTGLALAGARGAESAEGHIPMPEGANGGRFPGYDVLAKRHTPSWNAQTRRVIDAAPRRSPRSPNSSRPRSSRRSRRLQRASCRNPTTRPPIPVAALVDHKLYCGKTDGYRHAGLPREREAWRVGLRALDAEAQTAQRQPFSRARCGPAGCVA